MKTRRADPKTTTGQRGGGGLGPQDGTNVYVALASATSCCPYLDQDLADVSVGNLMVTEAMAGPVTKATAIHRFE